jgi:hypothetical protein
LLARNTQTFLDRSLFARKRHWDIIRIRMFLNPIGAGLALAGGDGSDLRRNPSNYKGVNNSIDLLFVGANYN